VQTFGRQPAVFAKAAIHWKWIAVLEVFHDHVKQSQSSINDRNSQRTSAVFCIRRLFKHRDRGGTQSAAKLLSLRLAEDEVVHHHDILFANIIRSRHGVTADDSYARDPLIGKNDSEERKTVVTR
jgi:hypothetical protein